MIYFRKALGLPKPDAEATMESILQTCQEYNGGMCVDYSDNLDVWGNPNTETTALVGLANVVLVSPPSPNTPVWLLIVSGVLGAIIASGSVTFCFVKVRKKS